MKKFLLVTAAAMMLLPSLASARVFFGVGPRFGYGYGGYGYGYGPYWGGPYYGGIYRAPTTGSVKFDTPDKNAAVYVNEAFAGTVGQVKTLHLRPGSYNIQVVGAGGTNFDKKVYVTAGGTVRIRPEFQPLPPPTAHPTGS